MGGERFQAPSIRAIIIGIGVMVIGGVLIICKLSNIVKTVGWVLLLIPQQLGVIEQTCPEEIQMIDLSKPDQKISFARSGPFLVYYEFPFVTNDIVYGENAPPHLVITCSGPNAQVPLGQVERGLRPYDTPFAKGRPVYEFTLSAPDSCQLTHSLRPSSISIVPDHVTGKEANITAAFAVELCILGAVFGTPLYMRVRRRRRQWQEHRQQAAARAEALRRVMRSNETGSKER